MMLNYLIVLISTLLIQSPSSKDVEIQYLANEGILIQSDSIQILVDAIFKKEFDYLDVLPDTELSLFENAKEKYESIDLILATHLHGDHFNADLIGKHMMLNQHALFVGPVETVEDFRDKFDSFQNVAHRINAYTPELFEHRAITLKNVNIEIFRFEHFGTLPWNAAENIGYLITINNKKILHLGDSKIDVKNLQAFNLSGRNIDVAILPYWQLGSAEQRQIIEKYINPKKILLAHIPLAAHGQAQDQMEGLGYENVTPLVNQFKSFTIK